MAKIVSVISQKVIEYSFYALLFLVPLVLTPINYELFEYNKMMLTYGFTVIIVGAWFIKIIIQKRINFNRTPLDIPLILYLISQVVSTIFSIDRHVSIWGYYSRFNGGLLSTISYILLYYAFVSNFPAAKIKKLLKIALFSGILVSIYGILEHLGIDKNIWVQDVQNRVFSTLGQPNWLAAYLAVLIPITIGMALQYFTNQFPDHDAKIKNAKVKSQNYKSKFKTIGLLDNWIIGLLVFISSVFYITLVFTKSRSGFLGFWIADIIFLILILVRLKNDILRPFLIINSLFLILTFLFASPFDQINKFTLPELTTNHPASPAGGQLPTNNQSVKPIGGSVIEVGITESGTIRRIVWNGAWDIFRHNPLIGTGVETFAFSYYKYRPVEHNMTSEWDFLYNKAHNEYLNYAATTGIFGLGSYMLIILVFIGWNLKNIKYQISNIKNTTKNEKLLALNSSFDFCILNFALFSAWLSILITNFFGFSVVIIQLFFFLIPAIVFILQTEDKAIDQPGNLSMEQWDNGTISFFQLAISLIIIFFIFYILYFISRLWWADVLFAEGYHLAHSQDIAPAYQSIKNALEINDEEPFYYDEFSYPAAELAVALWDDKQATLSATLVKEAIIASNFAIGREPNNVNYWKTRTRVYYALAGLEEKYFADSISSLEQAKKLAPTDPKVRYNLALMYDRVKKKTEAFDELTETTRLKPDYRDAFFALAYLYEKDNKREKAKESLKYILTKIATNDAEAKKKLEELQ